MLFKLSLKNIKKSLKDYGIYFFTLVFAVAMFYMFNSIDAQSSMLELTKSKSEAIEAIVYILSYVSVFVSIILGFLIVYSNNFLIKRRKKEIGIYYTLGMSKRKVSFILLIETILIGLFSLVIGLILGVFLSQFLSLLTAKIFEVNMISFKFIFSSASLMKTILYFAIIFIFVIIFNVITLSRHKLIDLMSATKKNEKVKFRNKYTIIITFILSVVLIGYAYKSLFDGNLLLMDKETIYMFIAGAFGTFFLFFSLSGFLLKIIEKIKKIYYKNLNIFVLKQINNKINTNVISNTIICLMLLLTIGILSGSMSLANAFNNDLRNNNKADFTINHVDSTYVLQNNKYVRIKNKILELSDITKDKEFKKFSNDFITFKIYEQEDIDLKAIITKKEMNQLIEEYGKMLNTNFKIQIMRVSDYNKLMKLYNEEDKQISLKENEYAELSNVDMMIDYYKKFYETEKNTITINNKVLKPGTDKIMNNCIENYNANNNLGVIIVSDNIVNGLKLNTQFIEGNFVKTKNVEKQDKEFRKYISNNSNNVAAVKTKEEMAESNMSLKLTLVYLGLYLGILFAICSATVLAIEQLSESSDNKDRYRVLRDLGADNKIINRALFIQICYAFMFPLIIAIIHSIVGLKEINKLINTLGSIDVGTNIILTSLFIIILYGGYFLITYLCSKNIIKKD